MSKNNLASVDGGECLQCREAGGMINSASALYKQKFRGDLDIPQVSPARQPSGNLDKSPLVSPVAISTPRGRPLATPGGDSGSPRPDSFTRANYATAGGMPDVSAAEAEAWGAEQARTAHQQLAQMRQEMRKQESKLQAQIEQNAVLESKISIVDAKLDDILRVVNTWPVSLDVVQSLPFDDAGG